MTRALSVILAVLAPPACLCCAGPGVAVGGDPVCPGCRAAMPWLDGPRCPRCALPAPCGQRRCPAAGAAFAAAWAPVAHDGPARALVHALKFRGARAAAGVMAAQMAAMAPAWALPLDAALVPVPMPAGRRRRRGLDHAVVLARALGDRSGRPVAPCLVRAGRAGPRQAGAPRGARTARGRVAVRARGPAPRSAVLVDDVHTTGATLDACARALRAAGAERVVAVTYARALRHGA